MARIPVLIAASGLVIATAAALTGSAIAWSPFDRGTVPLDPYYSTLQFVIVGSTDAGKRLQWVDESEGRRPDKPDLPQIDAGTWVPATNP